MRIVIAVVVAAFLSIAHGVTLPPDASMFVTDDDGVIVGVGRCHAGETFVLDVIATYQGFARLVIVTNGGEVVVHEVVVTEGTVLLEFVDLRELARRSGFVGVFVAAIDVFDAAYALLPAGAGGPERGPATDVSLVGSPGVPAPPTDAGQADQAPDDRPGAAPTPGGPVTAPPIGVPAVPPTVPAVPPAGPPDTPSEPGPPGATSPPGPPASTPGLPDGPPAHGPGGAQGDGPQGQGAPPSDGEHGVDGHPDDDPSDRPGQGRRP